MKSKEVYMKIVTILIFICAITISSCNSSQDSEPEELPEGVTMSVYERRLLGTFDEVTSDKEQMHYDFNADRTGAFYMTEKPSNKLMGSHTYTWTATADTIYIVRTDTNEPRNKYISLAYEWRGDVLCLDTAWPTEFRKRATD